MNNRLHHIMLISLFAVSLFVGVSCRHHHGGEGHHEDDNHVREHHGLSKDSPEYQRIHREHHPEEYREGFHHKFSDVDKYARMFEDPDRHVRQKPDEVVKKMNLKNGNRVADIGAGTGYFTRRFARAVAPDGEVYGYDIEPGMVKYMKKDAVKLKLNNYHAVHVKPDDPGLRDSHFDVVFICNTYHHISDRIKYFARIRKALKKGGRLVIVDFYKKNMPYGPPLKHKLSRAVVTLELEKAGYRMTRYLDFLPDQYFLEFVVKK